MNVRETAIPYYVQVAETLRRRILTGEYPEGELIPPGQELENEFRVSNITIRKALELLTQDGILQRKRGVGTVVPRLERDVVTFELGGSFHRLVSSLEKLPLEMEVLEIAVVSCPERVRRMMGSDPEKKIWRMKKIRRHHGIPICYYVHYSDGLLCQNLTKERAEKDNFVRVFQEITKLKLVSMEQRLEAAVADLDLSNMLQLRFGAPLLFVENCYFVTGHKAVILTQIYYRGDKCAYTARTDLTIDAEI